MAAQMNFPVKVELGHRSSIQGARWAAPIGWEPENTIADAEFTDGAWWDATEEVAGLLYFGEGEEGEQLTVELKDLRVASCGNCRVIGEVEYGEEVEEIEPGVYATADGDIVKGA